MGELAVRVTTASCDGLPNQTLTLLGPVGLIQQALDYAEASHAGARELPQETWPIFILSGHREKKALLNYETPHCLGLSESSPIIFLVCHDSEVDAYRQRWPQILIIAHNAKCVGHIRFLIQMVNQSGAIVDALSSMPRRRLGGRRVIVADDLVSCFYKLDKLTAAEAFQANRHNSAGGCRVTHRLTRDTSECFRKAFLEVAQYPMSRWALAGYLRDDGTCCTKKKSWDSGSLALYKVVILNIPELAKLGVQLTVPERGAPDRISLSFS